MATAVWVPVIRVNPGVATAVECAGARVMRNFCCTCPKISAPPCHSATSLRSPRLPLCVVVAPQLILLLLHEGTSNEALIVRRPEVRELVQQVTVRSDLIRDFSIGVDREEEIDNVVR